MIGTISGMAFPPVELTNGTLTVVADSPEELAQFLWDGFRRTDAPVPPAPLPPGLPAYLQLESLEAQFVQSRDFHIGAVEPDVKREGMLWFRPKLLVN